MLRIGGDVRGFVIASTDLPEFLGDQTARLLVAGLWFVEMTQEWATHLDVADGRAPGHSMQGFDLLSAGAISFAEQMSITRRVAYIERHFGLELVDCSVAWSDGKICAGPTGSAVTAATQRSAANEALDALGVDQDMHPTVLSALALI